MNTNEFSEWLRNEMKERNLSCCKLATMTGLNHVTIGFYVTGTRSPTFASLKLILDAFGKHIEIVDN